MRGVFDEREAERDRRRRGRGERGQENERDETRDREVTLGSFTLLAILCGLVVLCGLSFGLGYVVGRKEPAAQATVLEPTPITAQGDTAKTKPSGGTGSSSGSNSATEPADEPPGSQGAEESGQHAGGPPQGSDAGDARAQAGSTEAGKRTQAGEQDAAGSGQAKPAQTAVRNQLPAPPKVAPLVLEKTVQTQATTLQPEATVVQPALEPTPKKAQPAATLALMVQIATLANQEDADVLVEALRRKGYAVAAQRDLADAMVHVRVGPFASREVANQWRQKLLNDGYNAVVQ
jgi:cell division protein FtsN